MENTQEGSVHLLYKKLGETPLECLLRFKKTDSTLAPLQMTYAGRLDPMAEGLLLVLSGNKVYEKDSFINLPKTYEFEILWEFDTDTQDILGMVTSDDLSLFPTVDHIEKEVKNSVGKFVQKYPAYSSQPVNGKSLIQWAREGRIGEVEIPSHEVEIYDAKYISRRFENGKNLLNIVSSRIGLVTGDFRQEKILAEWKKVLEKNEDKDYAIDLLSVSVSGGFYVRQFVSDLAKKMNLKATTYHILRKSIGDYYI